MFAKTSSSCNKQRHIFSHFLAKYFNNHNIGPRCRTPIVCNRVYRISSNDILSNDISSNSSSSNFEKTQFVEPQFVELSNVEPNRSLI
jgi:hypothetical protein